MSTILERMREGAVCKESGNRCRSVEARSGCDCAAADEIEALQMEKEFNASQYRAEIERLTADNERLREGLEFVAEGIWRPDTPHGNIVSAMRTAAKNALGAVQQLTTERK